MKPAFSVTCIVFLSSNCDGGGADACRPSRSGSELRCSASQAEQHIKLARAKLAKTWKVHARSLEYTDELPASWQRARDAASSILNLSKPALPP